MRLDKICNTLGGHPCYMLTITSNINTYMSSEDEALLLNKSHAGRSLVNWRLVKYEETAKWNEGWGESNNTGKIKSLFKDKWLLANEAFSPYLRDHKDKWSIGLTCWVHPGESNASFVCEGIINFLMSNSKDAQ